MPPPSQRGNESGPSNWKGDAGRLKVLVESQDAAERWAITEEFRAAGFEVASCGGPFKLAKGSCQLVADGICPTAAGADVIFHRFDVADPAHEEILVALKRTYQGKPILVEVAKPAFEEHSALLDGCQVIFMPALPAAMVAGIRQAALRPARPATPEGSPA